MLLNKDKFKMFMDEIESSLYGACRQGEENT